MKTAEEQTRQRDTNLADDRIIYTDKLVHILLIETLIENQKMKRKINVLEGKLKIEAAKHERMTSGRVR